MYISRELSRAFVYLKEKILSKIRGWKIKFMSKAGKEILIKAVAQAIRSYAMACFDLSKGLSDDITHKQSVSSGGHNKMMNIEHIGLSGKR
jgi:hypothetical protein